jgi:hypothetical protein
MAFTFNFVKANSPVCLLCLAKLNFVHKKHQAFVKVYHLPFYLTDNESTYRNHPKISSTFTTERIWIDLKKAAFLEAAFFIDFVAS